MIEKSGLLVLSIGSTSSPCILMMILSLSALRVCKTIPKEHIEDVVSIKVILASIVVLLLLPICWSSWLLFSASFIVDRSLLRIAQTREGLIDLLESFICLGITILVRMNFQRSLLVGFLDFILTALALSESQYLIVVLL